MKEVKQDNGKYFIDEFCETYKEDLCTSEYLRIPAKEFEDDKNTDPAILFNQCRYRDGSWLDGVRVLRDPDPKEPMICTPLKVSGQLPAVAYKKIPYYTSRIRYNERSNY